MGVQMADHAEFAGTYLVSPKFIIDAYWGWTRLSTNIDTPGLDEQRGQMLGIPGTNGPAKYQGGMPRFAVSLTQLVVV
jgi:hypothetical protein